MKRIIPGLLIGIVFLSACGGSPPVTNAPVISTSTVNAPASSPTAAPTEVVIPIPKKVLSNYLTEATGETGVTPNSINELDLSVVGTDQTKVVADIEAAAGQSAKAIESWNVSWLWANGYLDDENGNSPTDYEAALKVFDERYEFVGHISRSGSWNLSPREKDTGKVGRAVDGTGRPLDASLMPLNVGSLDDFDLEFDGEFVTSNSDGSVFSLVVTDGNGNPIEWFDTETGQMVAEEAQPQQHLTLEDWNKLLSVPYIGDDGSHMPDSTVLFEDYGTTYTSDNLEEYRNTVQPNAILIARMPSGKAIIWPSKDEGEQLMAAGGSVYVTTELDPRAGLKGIFYAAQAAQEQGIRLWVTFRKNSLTKSAPFDLRIGRDIPLDENGETPWMPVLPERITVDRGDQYPYEERYVTLESLGIDRNDPKWAQLILDLGFTAIGID